MGVTALTGVRSSLGRLDGVAAGTTTSGIGVMAGTGALEITGAATTAIWFAWRRGDAFGGIVIGESHGVLTAARTTVLKQQLI
jgi:hypothetical protein